MSSKVKQSYYGEQYKNANHLADAPTHQNGYVVNVNIKRNATMKHKQSALPVETKDESFYDDKISKQKNNYKS